MKRKSISILLAACMVLTRFTGCAGESRENVDYGLEENSTEGVIGSTLAQFANEEKWTENFTVTKADGLTMEVQIDAEIRIPSADHIFLSGRSRRTSCSGGTKNRRNQVSGSFLGGGTK